jgi:hypothetical protein
LNLDVPLPLTAGANHHRDQWAGLGSANHDRPVMAQRLLRIAENLAQNVNRPVVQVLPQILKQLGLL